jgi:hypothetical protein
VIFTVGYLPNKIGTVCINQNKNMFKIYHKLGKTIDIYSKDIDNGTFLLIQSASELSESATFGYRKPVSWI